MNLRLLPYAFICLGLVIGCSASPPAATTPPATPTAVAPTAAPPTPTPSPTVSPASGATKLGYGETALEAGQYSTEFEGHRYTFSVPAAGWTANTGSEGAWIVNFDGSGAMASLFLFGNLSDVPADGCRGVYTFPGPSAADFATALAATGGFEVSGPTDVTVGDHHGKRLQLAVPEDANFASCTDASYHGLDGRYNYHPGDVDDVRIVDVDGLRNVFQASYESGMSTELSTELDQLAESVEIEPVAN